MPQQTPDSPLVHSGEDLDGFVTSLDGFMRAIRSSRGRYIASQDDVSDLTLAQYHMLEALLDQNAPLAVSELAMFAAVKPPTATRMLHCLERDLYVTRERPEVGDRRAVLIALTDRGRLAMTRKRSEIAELRQAIFASLTTDEREQAGRILARLAEVIEEYR